MPFSTSPAAHPMIHAARAAGHSSAGNSGCTATAGSNTTQAEQPKGLRRRSSTEYAGQRLVTAMGFAALFCVLVPNAGAQASAGSAPQLQSASVDAAQTSADGARSPLPGVRVATASSTRPAIQMPTGVLFIYDADGAVSMQQGLQTIRAEDQQTIDAAQPIRVSLGNNGSIALVFSNGVGMWAKGPGSFTINRFEQTPFQGNSRQNNYEPTSSALEIDLGRGTFAFAERQLSALSSMRLTFGAGNVLDTHETASFLVQVGGGVQENQDRISVLNGRALLHSDGLRGSAILIGSGQYLLQERTAGTSAQQLRLPEQLTSTQQELDARTANHARVVNDKVWFIREAGSEAAYAQVVVPLNFWLGKPHAATRVR